MTKENEDTGSFVNLLLETLWLAMWKIRKISNLCLFASLPCPQRYIKRVDPHLNNSCLDETRSAYDSHMDIYGQKYHVNYSCQASSDLLCFTSNFN